MLRPKLTKMSSTSSPSSGNLPEQPVIDQNQSMAFKLDILRGKALLGLLVLSIWEFGGFTRNQQQFFSLGHHGGNYKLMSLVSLLLEGKMLALLALVFGAGLVLFMQKKEQSTQPAAPDAWIRHMIWLIIFGVFNAFVLLWSGDILFSLGIMGILLFPFWRMRPRGLLMAALLCTLIFCGKQYWNYCDDSSHFKKYTAILEVEKKFKQDSINQAKKDSINIEKNSPEQIRIMDSVARKNDTLTKKQAEDKGMWEGMVKGMKYDSAKTLAENKAMRSTNYGKIWNHLLPNAQFRESFYLYRMGIWELGAMILLGMFLFGIGFFNLHFSTFKYLLIALVCLAVGFSLAWFRIHYSNIKLYDYGKYIEKQPLPPLLFYPVEIMLMTIGYVSFIMMALRLKLLKWTWAVIAAVGRMALTNYIMQTIICTLFFYGYGFGYFGRLTQLQLYFMVVEVWLVQLIFSVFWLRYYTMGPLEWLWKSLVYRKWLPWKTHYNNAANDSAND